MPRLTCFDCPRCHQPFAAEPDLPQSPMTSEDMLFCRGCSRGNAAAQSATFILNMLENQPLTRTDDGGWRPNGRLTPWSCPNCFIEFTKFTPGKPMLYRCCQRLACQQCSIRHAADPHECVERQEAVDRGGYLKVVRNYQDSAREYNLAAEYGFEHDDDSDLDFEIYGGRRHNAQYRPPGGEWLLTARADRAEAARARMNAYQQPERYGDFRRNLPLQGYAKPVAGKNAAGAPKVKKNDRVRIEPVQPAKPGHPEPPKVENGPYVLPDRAGVVVDAADLNETCGNCQRSFGITDLFSCTECDGMTLCGACCFRGHRTHECVDLKERKLEELERTTTEFLSQHYAGLRGNIQGVHAEIEDAQKDLVQACEETLKLVPGQADYGIGARICAELKATADDFEKCFEAYLPHARMYGTNLQNLKDKVHKFVGDLEKSKNGDW